MQVFSSYIKEILVLLRGPDVGPGEEASGKEGSERRRADVTIEYIKSTEWKARGVVV